MPVIGGLHYLNVLFKAHGVELSNIIVPFFLNATVSLSVIALLAAGATLPIFVFNRRAFSLTRRRKSDRPHPPKSSEPSGTPDSGKTEK